MIELKTLNDVVIFNIKVSPGSSKSAFSNIEAGILKIKLNSPPVDGKANEECVRLLSKALKVSKTSITILSGEKSKLKRIQVSGDVREIVSKLEEIANSLG
jgi:uncharacterized protein (TIGR00251 family)